MNPEYLNKLISSVKELLKVYALIYEPIEEVNDLLVCYVLYEIMKIMDADKGESLGHESKHLQNVFHENVQNTSEIIERNQFMEIKRTVSRYIKRIPIQQIMQEVNLNKNLSRKRVGKRLFDVYTKIKKLDYKYLQIVPGIIIKSFRVIGAIMYRYGFKQLEQKLDNFEQREIPSTKTNSTMKISDDPFARAADVYINEIYNDLGRLEKNIRQLRENKDDMKYSDLGHDPIKYLTTLRNGRNAVKQLNEYYEMLEKNSK